MTERSSVDYRISDTMTFSFVTDGQDRHLAVVLSHLCNNGWKRPDMLMLDLPWVNTQERFAGRRRWTVQSWEPLTLDPSYVCSECGLSGWVRKGEWVDDPTSIRQKYVIYIPVHLVIESVDTEIGVVQVSTELRHSVDEKRAIAEILRSHADEIEAEIDE